MIIKTTRANNNIKLTIPRSIKIFNDNLYTLNRILEGFLVKKASIDSSNIRKYPKNGTICLSSNIGDLFNNIEGDYDIEIEDEDILRLIKI